MPYPPDFDETSTYSNRYDLDKLDVYLEGDGNLPMYFSVDKLSPILTYGKHYFHITLLDSELQDHELAPNSKLLFELKSKNNVVIQSNVTGLRLKNGAATCTIHLLKDPLRSLKEIEDGSGTLTIVGQLKNKPTTTNIIPNRYLNRMNYRCVFPINIRKELPNISPILFQNPELIQSKSIFSESIDLDAGDSNYKRSYINVSASHLQTFGGRVDKIELSYRESRSQNEEFKIFNTYKPTSTIYEITASEAFGLNPLSDEQKFPTPREIRRNGNIDFRLRFLNSDNELAQNITQNNVDVEITGSIIGFTGSAIILETDDNLVTGSGALVFGKNIENGIHAKFDDTDEAVKFEKFEDGVKKENLFEVSDKDGGKILAKPDVNKSTISSGSAILAGENNEIFDSSGSAILSGVLNKITGSEGSTIVSGDANIISQSKQTTIGGGINNRILGSSFGGIFSGKDNLISMKGNAFVFNLIVGGGGNQITSSQVDGAKHNVIVGGSANKIYENNEADEKNVIVGGAQNKIFDVDHSFIGGGNGNEIRGGSSLSQMFATIPGGKQNIIKLPGDSGLGITIGGGAENEITASTNSDFIFFGTTIAGGYQNKIYSSEANNASTFIGGGRDNKIQESIEASILGGRSNTITNANSGSILGGNNNNLNHDNSFIIGSDLTSATTNTLYVNNLDIAGSLSVSQITSSIVSSSIIFSSGSNIFGDTISDTHLFNGHITASGNISASGGGSFGDDTSIIKSNDGGDVSFTIRNSAGIGSTDETTSLLFGTTTTADKITAKIVSGREQNYAGSISNEDGFLAFYTDLNSTQTEYMRITSAGNIGIGNTSPTKPLQVTGDISASGELKVESHITASGNISASGTSHTIGGFTMGGADGTIVRNLSIGSSLIHDGDTNTSIGFLDDTINFAAGGTTSLTLQEGHVTASGNISCSGEYIGNQVQIYQANFSDDIGTTTHFVPLGTSTFEQTTEDDDAVGLVAPYDGEVVKIIYRHNFDATSTTTRWTFSVITDGTDLNGTPVSRFRGTVTGADTDTIKEITVDDADTAESDDFSFSKGETIYIGIRNGSDVTSSTINDEFHITVVIKFNIPLGLI